MKNIKEIIKGKKMLMLSLILVLIIATIIVCVVSKNKKIETSSETIEEAEEYLEQDFETEDSDNLEDVNNIETVQEENEDENVIENTNKKSEKNDSNTKNNSTPYYIKVNYGAQVVTVYKKDSNGNYTTPVKAMVCSTGSATPKSGVYSIPGRWAWGALFGNVYGQYCVKITGNILFHSVPYLRGGDHASLEYWEYDKLGTAASAGCIRLKVEDAKWIFNNCVNGTKVEFYSSSNPGPLGKPSAKKISSYPDYLRNWDPTDPNSNNPWKTYKENNTNEAENSSKTDNTKTENAEKNEKVTNSAKPENAIKNETTTNSTKLENTVKNETTTNSTKPENTVKNETTTNSTKPENVVKNEVTNIARPENEI